MKPERPNLEEQLSAYLDGELTAAERAEVEAWLAEDERARRTFAALKRQAAMLGGLPRAKAPDDLLELVTARMERRELLGDAAGSFGPGFSFRRVGRWLASAAVVVMAATGGYLTYVRLQPERGPRPSLLGPVAERPAAAERGRGARDLADEPTHGLDSAPKELHDKAFTKDEPEALRSIAGADRDGGALRGKIEGSSAKPSASGVAGDAAARAAGRATYSRGYDSAPHDTVQIENGKPRGGEAPASALARAYADLKPGATDEGKAAPSIIAKAEPASPIEAVFGAARPDAPSPTRQATKAKTDHAAVGAAAGSAGFGREESGPDRLDAVLGAPLEVHLVYADAETRDAAVKAVERSLGEHAIADGGRSRWNEAREQSTPDGMSAGSQSAPVRIAVRREADMTLLTFEGPPETATRVIRSLSKTAQGTAAKQVDSLLAKEGSVGTLPAAGANAPAEGQGGFGFGQQSATQRPADAKQSEAASNGSYFGVRFLRRFGDEAVAAGTTRPAAQPEGHGQFAQQAVAAPVIGEAREHVGGAAAFAQSRGAQPATTPHGTPATAPVTSAPAPGREMTRLRIRLEAMRPPTRPSSAPSTRSVASPPADATP